MEDIDQFSNSILSLEVSGCVDMACPNTLNTNLFLDWVLHIENKQQQKGNNNVNLSEKLLVCKQLLEHLYAMILGNQKPNPIQAISNATNCLPTLP